VRDEGPEQAKEKRKLAALIRQYGAWLDELDKADLLAYASGSRPRPTDLSEARWGPRNQPSANPTPDCRTEDDGEPSGRNRVGRRLERTRNVTRDELRPLAAWGNDVVCTRPHQASAGLAVQPIAGLPPAGEYFHGPVGGSERAQ
jgi:hypothetical protein